MIANAGKANEMTSKEYTNVVYLVYQTLSATIAKSNNSVSYNVQAPFTPTLTLFSTPHSSPQFKCIIISLYYVFLFFLFLTMTLFLCHFLFYSCYCWCLLLLLLVLLMLLLLLLLLPLGSFFHLFFCYFLIFVCSLFAHFQLKHSSSFFKLLLQFICHLVCMTTSYVIFKGSLGCF